MPTPTKGARLGGSPSHQRLVLANLATALFEHGRITTTEAKARRLRPFAERLVTKAKRGDLHARRQVAAVIHDKSVVHELFTEIAPGYAGRAGGYTRITKLGPRKGDNAPMAVIELVEPLAEQTVAAATAATKRAAADREAAKPTEDPKATEQAKAPEDSQPAESDVDATESDPTDEVVAEAEEAIGEIEAEAADSAAGAGDTNPAK